jgi:hypothetical protein
MQMIGYTKINDLNIGSCQEGIEIGLHIQNAVALRQSSSVRHGSRRDRRNDHIFDPPIATRARLGEKPGTDQSNANGWR